MRIVIVAEHVRRQSWHHGRWAIDISSELIARGHRVTLVCDAIEDHRQLDPAIGVVERTPERHASGREPMRFQRWAMDRMSDCAGDAIVSLSRLVPAGLWLPVDPPSAPAFVRDVSSGSLVSALFESASRSWILGAIRAERCAEAMARSSGLKRARLGIEAGGDGVLSLGLASRLEPSDRSRRDRRRLRDRLGLSETRPVLLCSIVDRPVSCIRSLLEAIARSRRSAGPPALIVLTREPVRLHRLASSLGALPRVRILGASSRMGVLFSACDAVALPVCDLGSTARMAGDAIAMHCPVIAAAGAPGSAFIEPERFGTPPIGRVLSDVTCAGWQSVLDQMLDPVALGPMRAAASSLAPMVGFPAFTDRLEAGLRS